MIIGKFESPDDRNYEGQVPTFTSSTVAIRPTDLPGIDYKVTRIGTETEFGGERLKVGRFWNGYGPSTNPAGSLSSLKPEQM